MTSHPHAELKYRPDIDGLRAIAVGVVVLFHAKLGFFPGGYTGVDVFFVISGFLISSIIWRELGEGSFTIAGFYERRIRRIFPALAVVMLATLIMGALFLAPQDYATLGRSARATAAFYSNFYFNNQFGYFMPGAETQPLLHTWSLAVEEQFYLVAPIFLILLARMQSAYRTLLFLALFAASLAHSSIGAFGESKAAFYLPHSRAFELMLGMALAFGLAPKWRNDVLREGAAFAGLAIVAAVAIFYTDTTPFPGLAALVPCLGTMLLISTAAEKPTMVSRVLAARPMVAVGKISYSLYLWHWPLFKFAEYQYGEHLPWAYTLGLIAVSAVLSLLTYRFVEKPARQRSFLTRRTVIAGGFATLAVIYLAAHVVVDTQGVPQRLPKEAAEFAMSVESKVTVPCPDPAFGNEASREGCEIGAANGQIAFLLWGDSHAMMLAARMAQYASQDGVKGAVAVAGGCAPFLARSADPKFVKTGRCRAMTERVNKLLKGPGSPHVVIAARWALYSEGNSFHSGGVRSTGFDAGDAELNHRQFATALKATVQAIVASGRRVTIVGPVPELKGHLPNAIVRALMRGEQPPTTIPYQLFEERERFVLQTLSEFSEQPGVRVLWPHAALCSDQTCKTSGAAGHLYFDDNHLNAAGVDEIADVIRALVAVDEPRN